MSATSAQSPVSSLTRRARGPRLSSRDLPRDDTGRAMTRGRAEVRDLARPRCEVSEVPASDLAVRAAGHGQLPDRDDAGQQGGSLVRAGRPTAHEKSRRRGSGGFRVCGW